MSRQYGFQITAPSPKWLVTNQTPFPFIPVMMVKRVTMEGAAPVINVAVEPLKSKTFNAKSYADASEKTLEAKGIKVKRKKPRQIGKYVGYELDSQLPDLKARMRQIYIYRQQKGYVITCTMSKAYFRKLEKECERAIKSFRFLE